MINLIFQDKTTTLVSSSSSKKPKSAEPEDVSFSRRFLC